MKKLIITLLCVQLFGHFNYATEPVSSEIEEKTHFETNAPVFSHNNSLSALKLQDTQYTLQPVNIQLDVLGLMFFGAQLAVDFQFIDMIAVGPFFRWHYAGFLYHAAVTNWFDDGTTVNPGSFSVGGHAKVLLPLGTGKHRPMFIAGYERSSGSRWRDPGGTWGKYTYEYESNVFHFGAGYRNISNSAFNLTIAAAIGISNEIKSIGYYDYGGEIDSYMLETNVYPIIQIGLGWQFGN